MDKRKLIGTIIGVTMFAALIAGATFAFLSFTATVTDSTYNGTAMNFIVDYQEGTYIEDIPQLRSSTTAAPNTQDITMITPSEAASLVVVAKHHENSAKGYVTIKLTTTSQGLLTTDGLVNWVICRDPDVESGTQVDDVCGSGFPTSGLSGGAAINSGVITAGNNNTITLLSDAALAAGSSNKITPVNTSTETAEYLLYYDGSNHTDYSYFVYFWVNSTKITNAHLLDTNNKYSAYIHASATQLEE